MQQFSRPYQRLKRFSAFCQNAIFLKDQNMKKYQHYIDSRGEVLPTPHRNNDNLEKSSSKNHILATYVVFFFKMLSVIVVVVVPPTAKVIWRRGHGLKSHPTDWRSRESNLRPLVYKASDLSTTPQRLLMLSVILLVILT